jgi:hypothetical protein
VAESSSSLKKDMGTASDPRPGDEEFDGFRMRLPDDCVEYMLFIIGERSNSHLPSLETVRRAADKKLNELAKDYIWQRDGFNLKATTHKGASLSLIPGMKEKKGLGTG